MRNTDALFGRIEIFLRQKYRSYRSCVDTKAISCMVLVLPIMQDAKFLKHFLNVV